MSKIQNENCKNDTIVQFAMCRCRDLRHSEVRIERAK